MAPQKDYIIDPQRLLKKVQELRLAIDDSPGLKVLRAHQRHIVLGELIGFENFNLFIHIRIWLGCLSDGQPELYQNTGAQISLAMSDGLRSWLEECDRVLRAFMRAFPDDRVRLLGWKRSLGFPVGEMVVKLNANDDRRVAYAKNEDLNCSSAVDDGKPVNAAVIMSAPLSTDSGDEDSDWEIVGGVEEAGGWSLVHDL